MKKIGDYHPYMERMLSEATTVAAPLLAAFDAAAREGHITHAAHRLGVPQSSVSRRIKSLEHILGIALFQPTGRGVALTPAGRDLHVRTRELIHDLDDAITAVRSHADPDGGLVRFGFPLTLGPVSIPSLLADFHHTAPGIRLHLVQEHGAALAEMIRDGRLDLAVTIPPPDDLPVTVLGYQPLALHVATDHHLADRSSVDPADLAGEQFIAGPPSYHIRSVLEIACARAGFDPQIVFEISEFETVRVLVSHGLGIALLPYAENPVDGIVTMPVRDIGPRTVGLATGTRELSPPAARLHAHLVAKKELASG